MVFLDLGMPLLDGYEACQLILQHYQGLASRVDVQQQKRSMDVQWLLDINKIQTSYQVCKNSTSPKELQQAQQLLSLFQELYKKVSFRTLDRLDRPFIFAYSALVDNETISKTKDAGFDGCLETKLGPTELQQVINDHIDNFAQKVIDRNLDTMEKKASTAIKKTQIT